MDNCTSLYDSLLVAVTHGYFVSVAVSIGFVAVIAIGMALLNHGHERAAVIIALSMCAAILVYMGYGAYQSRVEQIQSPQYVQEMVERKVQREIFLKEGKKMRYFQLSRKVRQEIDSLVVIRLEERNTPADTAACIHDDAIAP